MMSRHQESRLGSDRSLPVEPPPCAAARRTQVESAALLEQLHVVDATIVGGIERSPGLRFLGVVKPGVGGIGGGFVALATIIVLGVRVANVLASGG